MMVRRRMLVPMAAGNHACGVAIVVVVVLLLLKCHLQHLNKKSEKTLPGSRYGFNSVNNIIIIWASM